MGGWRVTGQLSALLMSWFMGMQPFFLWKSKLDQDVVAFQEDLTADDYKILMMDDLEDLNCHRLCALENIEANKLRIAKYYNKKVKFKQFHESELV